VVALEREIVEQIKKLNAEQQRKVLEFARRLTAESEWAQQPWTEDEIQEMLRPKRRTYAEVVAWLKDNPPTEPFGDIKPEEDSADYVHRMRRASETLLEDPGDATS
jgi:mRNA-degrading endonuclease RelE of RelBE toxin-antitoxin system